MSAEICPIFWCGVAQYLNGAFLSAMFGAGGGALATYWFATHSERRRRILDEIAGVNSAIGLASTIAGAGFSLKGQQINRLAAEYVRQFDRFRRVTLLSHYFAGRRQVVYEFTADFREVIAPPTLEEDLRRTIVDKVPTETQAIIIVNSAIQSVKSLQRVTEKRNETIAGLRNANLNDEERVHLYFGLRTSKGFDESYPDLMHAIILYTDDLIYFGILLCEVLQRHGARLARLYGKGAPAVKKMDYSNPRLQPLLPDRSNYPDFEAQYRGAKNRLLPAKWLRIRTIVLTRCIYRRVWWRFLAGIGHHARGR